MTSKCSFLCAIALFLHVPFMLMGQTVTIKSANQPLGKILTEIERQTGYVFNYTQPPVNPEQTVSLNVKGATLSQALDSLFLSSTLTYKIVGQKIFLTAREVKGAEETYNGTVIDQDGLPVFGAAVLIKNTKTGMMTDTEGHFSIKAPGGTQIEITAMGYITRNITLGNKKELKIILSVDATELEEVVMVGYSTRTREKLISAVSTASGSELVKSSVANLENALPGKVSGVFSRQTSGEPGRDEANLTIRGFGQALVVVDGIPGRNYSDIDPNEIESVSILKDASAASVYGMQGANGVILVTTKRGDRNRPVHIEATAKFTLQQAVNFPRAASSETYQTLLNEYNINRKLISNRNAVATPEQMAISQNSIDTDWYGEMLRLAPQIQANLNVSGGSGKVNYFVSGSYLRQEGIWKTNSISKDRFNIRSNLDIDLAKGLKASVSMGAVISKNDYPYNYSNYIAQTLKSASPTVPVKWHEDDPYYAFNGEGSRNPMALADPEACGYNNTKDNSFNIDAALEYKIPGVDGLSLKANLGYSFDNIYNRIWKVEERYIGYRQDSDEYYFSKSVDYADKADLTVANTDNMSLVFQGFVNYKNTFNNAHTINAGLVFELNSAEKRYFYTKRNAYPSTVTDRLFAGLSGANLEDGETYRTYHTLSVVERFSYDYKSRYFIDVNTRLDGAQYFAKKWGLFPSVSLGWMITNEPFMDGSKKTLKELKFRVSYGTLGDMSSAKAYYDSYEMYYYQAGYKYPGAEMKFGDRTLLSLEETVMANEDFTWAKSTIANVGFDFRLFRNEMLGGSIDVFYRSRSGLPALKANDNAGALATYYNLNSDNTRGVEFSLNHSNTVGEVSYGLALNASWSRTKWDHYEAASFSSGYKEWTNGLSGRWTNVREGFHVIGRYESWEEIDNAPYHVITNGNDCILPGDFKYEDVNGDGYIDSKDIVPIGRTAYPELMFGLNMNLTWRNLDFSAFFQGASLCDFTISDYDLAAFQNGNTQYNCWEFLSDRWHKADYTNPNSEWIEGRFPAVRDWSDDSINKYSNDAYIFDGTYLRLKNIELGYTIPFKTKGVNASKPSLRVYLASYNLFTISAQNYFDPESMSDQAWSFASYPQIRSFIVGVNFNF